MKPCLESATGLRSRAARTIRISIQQKILISFSIILFAGLSLLLYATYSLTESSFNRTVHKDMLETAKNVDLYVKQYFLIRNTKNTVAMLEVEANSVAAELAAEIGNPIEIYSSDGRLLSGVARKQPLSRDFSKTVAGEITYVVEKSGGSVDVLLTGPIVSDGQTIGIYRYTRDYSGPYKDTRNFYELITACAAGIFALIFVTSLVLARQITKPIRRLTVYSEKVAEGDFNLDVDIRSRDEIGELADRFQQMVERIKEQIGIIKRDRDALQASQEESKAFFDHVTHELKTPLTTILGYAQMMRDNGFSDPEFFDKGTAYIMKESKRLNSLVMDILELSKASSAEFTYRFEQVNLSELIRETCEEMNVRGRRYHIRINSDRVEDAIIVTGDRQKLKEALINVIDNSIKYASVRSDVLVESVLDDDGSVTVTVTDRGEGIPEKYLERLFEPFYRAPLSSGSIDRESAGLGLAIVRSILEKHGGTVHVASKVHEGTKVTLRLKGEDRG